MGTYLGAGQAGIRAAEALEREREAKKEAKRTARARIESDEESIRNLFADVEKLLGIALLFLGWVRHHRGYRKRIRKARAMFDEATFNDSLEAEKVRRLFDADPNGKLVEQLGGNLPKRVEEALIERFGGDHRGREAIRRAAHKLRADLTGPAVPTAIERIVIDRIVVAWLDVHLADLLALEGPDGVSGLTVELANLLDRRRDRANRRLLAATRALHLIRKVVPATAVNVSVTVKPSRRRKAQSSAPTAHEALSRMGRN